MGRFQLNISVLPPLQGSPPAVTEEQQKLGFPRDDVPLQPSSQK